MQTKSSKLRKQLKKEEGFTLVEVIAVLVILGILAAVAIPKFFDMQDTARVKAVQGALGELNGQVALSYAQAALNNQTLPAYQGYIGDLGGASSDFQITGQTAAAPDPVNDLGTPGSGKIGFRGTGFFWELNWTPGSGTSPGFFALGATTTAP